MILNSLLYMTMNTPDKGFNRNNTCRYISCYDNDVSFLNPIIDTQPSLMTMRCHSYTSHTTQSYDNDVPFVYLTLTPVFMTTMCHSYA